MHEKFQHSHFKTLLLTHHKRAPLSLLDESIQKKFSETVSNCDKALEKAFQKSDNQLDFTNELISIKKQLGSLYNSLAKHHTKIFSARGETPKITHERRLIILLEDEVIARADQIRVIMGSNSSGVFANARRDWESVHKYLKEIDDLHLTFYNGGKPDAKKFNSARARKNQILLELKRIMDDVENDHKMYKFILEDINKRFNTEQKQTNDIRNEINRYNSLERYSFALFKEYQAYYKQISAYWDYLSEISSIRK